MVFTCMTQTLCCIVPPDLLYEVIKRGKSEEEKERAIRTLEISEALRTERTVLSRMRGLRVAGHLDKRRIIYDANHAEDIFSLPGTPRRYESDEIDTGDIDVDNCFYNTGLVHDFFKDVFIRNSIDDEGMLLQSSVHFGSDFDNAVWTGNQMVYGDGSNVIFKKGSLTSLTVTAHELTHGITDSEAKLVYRGQPGALNEHMSDVFAVMCEQWVNHETAEKSDWMIGRNILVGDGGGLRSLKEPGTAHAADKQVSHMNDYHTGMRIHYSSGIPNKAFYITCVQIGGHSWEKAGKIWYVALRDKLREYSKFQDAADMTFEIAGSLFGEESDEQRAVYAGWKSVGIDAEPLNARSVNLESRTKIPE
jgi:Zn-dependent metalloprotease